MGETRQRTATLALAAALGLGFLAAWLLRSPAGLGATLWLLVALGAAALLARACGRLHGNLALGLAVAPLFALLLLWRDAPVLAELNVLAIVACLTLGLIPDGPGVVRLEELGHAALVWLGALLAGPLPLLRRGLTRLERAALLVLGALVALAAIRLGAGDVFLRLLLWTWIGAGLLRIAVFGGGLERSEETEPELVGAGEVALWLVALGAVVLAVVWVRLESLASGRNYVDAHEHATYAGQARSAFLVALVVVSVTVGALIVFERRAARTASARRLLGLLGGAAVLLALAVDAAALLSLRAYERTIGLTELRLYAFALLVWLAALLALLGATVLRRRPAHFGGALVASVLVAVVVLDVANPDAIIARREVHRSREYKIVDYGYLRTLSDDATPILVAALPELARPAQGAAPTTGPVGPVGPRSTGALSIRRLLDLHARCDADWRTWNRSRARARSLLCR